MSEGRTGLTAGTPGKARLKRLLAVVIGMEVCVILGLQAAPWIAGRREDAAVAQTEAEADARQVAWRRMEYREARDLRTGEGAPVTLLSEIRGAPVSLDRPGTRTAVIFVGDGGTCASRSVIGAWNTIARQVGGLKLVVVARQMVDDIYSDCNGSRRKDLTLTVALDQDGAAARRWNASWTPRAYVLDAQGKLLYVQPVTTMTPNAPLEAAQLLRRAEPRLALTSGPRGTSTGP